MTETFGLTLNRFRRVLEILEPKVKAQPSNSLARRIDRSAHAWLRSCGKEAGSPHFGTATFDEQEAWRIIVGLRRALEGADYGDVVLSEYGQWISAHAGPDGCLVQMDVNGTFHVDGELPLPAA